MKRAGAVRTGPFVLSKLADQAYFLISPDFRRLM